MTAGFGWFTGLWPCCSSTQIVPWFLITYKLRKAPRRVHNMTDGSLQQMALTSLSLNVFTSCHLPEGPHVIASTGYSLSQTRMGFYNSMMHVCYITPCLPCHIFPWLKLLLILQNPHHLFPEACPNTHRLTQLLLTLNAHRKILTFLF